MTLRPVSKTEFAKERKFSRARVYQLIDDGRLPVILEGEHAGKIDADEAHRRLDETLDRAKGMRRGGNLTSESPQAPDLLPRDELERPAPIAPPGGKREESDYWESKARRERAEASRAELRALQDAGALVSAAGVRKEAIETARRLRNAILALPDQLAPVLDPASPDRAHKLLTDELQKVLRELSAGLESDAAAAAAEAERPEEALA